LQSKLGTEFSTEVNSETFFDKPVPFSENQFKGFTVQCKQLVDQSQLNSVLSSLLTEKKLAAKNKAESSTIELEFLEKKATSFAFIFGSESMQFGSVLLEQAWSFYRNGIYLKFPWNFN
jgi:hypothetical protein